MRWLAPILAVAVLLQSTALAVWVRPGVIPDLALIVVVLFAGLRGWRQGLATGLIGGFIESLVSIAPLGVHLVRLAAIGVGAGVTGGRFERTSPLLPPALVAVATFAAALLATLSLQATGWVVAFSGFAAGELVFQASLNAALSIFLLPLLRLLVQKAPAEELRV